jgi:hypothetical protein
MKIKERNPKKYYVFCVYICPRQIYKIFTDGKMAIAWPQASNKKTSHGWAVPSSGQDGVS